MSYISAAQAKQIAQKAVDNLKDGTLVPKLADNMTPYAEDSGTTQTQPFFLEGTATGNGESRVDAKQVPAFAFLQEKRGNTVCVNQLLGSPQSVEAYGVTASYDSTTQKWHITGTATSSNYSLLITGNIYFYQSRNYLLKTTITGTKGGGYVGAYVANQINLQDTDQNGVISIPTASGNARLWFRAIEGETYDCYVTALVVDLTQWFNNSIPAYLLSHPEAFGRYYKGSLAYEPGRLEPATGRYLTSVGRNIWDEETEVGTYEGTSRLASKNFISVIPSTTYQLTIYGSDNNGIGGMYLYDNAKNQIGFIFGNPAYNNGRFTTPANCSYIKFYLSFSYGTTYKHDITISIYYTSESGYDKYYPYEVLATIDTGTEQLGAFDVKYPNGLIERSTGDVTFDGTETWTLQSINTYGIANFQISVSNTDQTGEAISNIFEHQTSLISVTETEGFFISSNSIYIRIKSTTASTTEEFKAWLSTHNVNIQYALNSAGKTTEQGTPFQENVPIDDFGPLSWSNTDVPQGNQIFYPVDYKAYEDTLIKYTDGDATSLALKGELASGDPQTLKGVVDYINGKIPAAPTTDGEYDLVCTVTNGTPTFSWVART